MTLANLVVPLVSLIAVLIYAMVSLTSASRPWREHARRLGPFLLVALLIELVIVFHVGQWRGGRMDMTSYTLASIVGTLVVTGIAAAVALGLGRLEAKQKKTDLSGAPSVLNLGP